jgi:hypothetical protein
MILIYTKQFVRKKEKRLFTKVKQLVTKSLKSQNQAFISPDEGICI